MAKENPSLLSRIGGAISGAVVGILAPFTYPWQVLKRGFSEKKENQPEAAIMGVVGAVITAAAIFSYAPITAAIAAWGGFCGAVTGFTIGAKQFWKAPLDSTILPGEQLLDDNKRQNLDSRNEANQSPQKQAESRHNQQQSNVNDLRLAQEEAARLKAASNPKPVSPAASPNVSPSHLPQQATGAPASKIFNAQPAPPLASPGISQSPRPQVDKQQAGADKMAVSRSPNPVQQASASPSLSQQAQATPVLQQGTPSLTTTPNTVQPVRSTSAVSPPASNSSSQALPSQRAVPPVSGQEVSAQMKKVDVAEAVLDYNKAFRENGQYKTGYGEPKVETRGDLRSVTFKFPSLDDPTATSFFREQAANKNFELKSNGKIIAVARDGRLFRPGSEGKEITEKEALVAKSPAPQNPTVQNPTQPAENMKEALKTIKEGAAAPANNPALSSENENSISARQP